MGRSFSYFLVSLVLKLKGVKKNFSQSPIDYRKVRKEDVKEPKGGFYKRVKRFSVLQSTITVIPTSTNSEVLILYVHGGAFISGPAQHHWDSLKAISKKTNNTIWMCDYPKAPESKISKISDNIDVIYQKAIEYYKPENIILIGDSVGGTLSVALAQRLIKNSKEVPSKIILISPVMDASLSNPKIDEIDKTDPMLSKKGILSSKELCAENGNLNAVEISPINGAFKNFPEIVLFLAENDITYPDQLRLVEKLEDNKANFKVITGKGMPHIWPLLPVMKEAKQALNQLINNIN